MSIASEIIRLQQAKAALKEAINKRTGIPGGSITDETIDEFAPILDGIPYSTFFEVGATTVHTSASTTANVASNDHIRIHGDDGKAYTIAEWNAMWVANGYSRDGMPTPDGFVVTKRNGMCEVLYFESFVGRLYTLDGASYFNNTLSHSIYRTLACVTSAASGTDATTGKAWSITSVTDTNGDMEDDRGNVLSLLYDLSAGTKYWALYTDNTKSTFYVPQGIGYTVALGDIDDFKQRTESIYQITEWMRHRFAIATGMTTSEADGTYTDVAILNNELNQPAVNEDMYFAIRDDNGDWQKCGLAKYNLNNTHDGSATSGVTAEIQDAIYNGQKVNGVNMNDTGVNSATRPLLAAGSKGAEAIVVDGEWYIITPYVTYASNMDRFADSPAVAWVRAHGWSMPSQDAIEVWYFNKTLVRALRNYLENIEQWTLPAIYLDKTIWCAGRSSNNYAWHFNTSVGTRYTYYGYNRYFVVGASEF